MGYNEAVLWISMVRPRRFWDRGVEGLLCDPSKGLGRVRARVPSQTLARVTKRCMQGALWRTKRGWVGSGWCTFSLVTLVLG